MTVTTTRMVLVTDLRRSTDLRVRIGDGAFDSLRREHDRLLGEAAAEHGGEVVKGSGDGIIALFGAAHEAIAAGVAMEQVIDRLNARSVDELELAIGISAGDVALEDGDCHGTPVVEAARLCSAAVRGEILVADVVRVLAGSRVTSELVFRGALELKGLPEPVVAYEVRWVSLASGGPPLPDALTSGPFAFAGRQRERLQLDKAWKTASAGSTQLVLISGEPGIGKTRLVGEFARDAHSDGDLVLFGRCEEDLAVPYQPFVEPLTALLEHSPELAGTHRDAHGGVLARLGASLVAYVGEPPPAEAAPEVERQRMFDAAADLLAVAATERPVLLVLDDLHWATAPTLSLLRHVLRHAPASALLVVGTYRDTDLDRTHPLAATLADLRRDGVGERIALGGLDGDEVADFVAGAAGQQLDATARSLAAAVCAETEGNPFFVGEVLRDLAESGSITQEGGQWVATRAIDALGLPQGVREVVGRRLSRLSDSTNRVLALAAVAGPKFEAAVLEREHEPASEVLDALDAAVATGLITEDTARVGWFGFMHALVRQTLLAELTAARRARMHQSIARAIEDEHRGDLDAFVPDLASHFGAAATRGDADRAVEYARLAAEQSFARLADEEAIAWLQRALEADELDAGADPHRRIELLTSLGALHFGRGERELSIDASLEAVQIARELHDEIAFVNAVARAVQAVPFGGTDARVEPLVAEALQYAHDRSRPRVELLMPTAWNAIYAPRGQVPLTLAEEAVSIAEELGDDELSQDARALRAHTLQTDPDAARHLAEANRAAEREREPDPAAAIGGRQPEILGTYIRGFARIRVGDLAGLGADRQSLLRSTAGDGRISLLAAGAVQWLALETMLTGPLRGVEEQIDAVLEHSGEEAMFRAGHALQLMWLRILQGRFDEAGSIADLLSEIVPEGILGRALFRANVRAEAGDVDAVAAQLAAIDGGPLRLVQPDWTRGGVLYHLAHAAALVGDAALGASVYELLRAYDGQLLLFACTHVVGSGAHALGLAAAGAGDTTAAIAHFENAIEFEDRVGARVLAARSRLALAQLIVSSDGPRARLCAHDAHKAATDLGMMHIKARAEGITSV